MPMSADAILDDLYNPDAAGWTSGKVRQLIVDESQKQGVDPALMLALAHQESRFQPAAVSPTGVVGVFQVTGDTGERYGQPRQDVDRANPAYSVPAGIAYMKDLLRDTNGDVPKALTRYNGGSDPRFAQNVLSRYRLHQEGAGGQGAQVAAKAMDAESILNDLYGPAQRTPAPAPSPAPATPGQLAPALPLATEEVGALPGMGMTGRPAAALPPAIGAPGVAPQMVIDIEKASAPGPGPGTIRPAQVGAAPLIHERTIDEGPGGYAEAGKTLGAMGTEAAGAYTGGMLGARIGSTVGPVGALVGGTLGAGIGAYTAHQANKALGLQPGEPGVMPQDLQDWLSLTAPMVPGGAQLARRGGAGVLARTQGGKALTEATLAEQEIARLKAIPAKYQPLTPSSDLYTEFTTRAGAKPIDLAPVKTILADTAFQEDLKYAPRLQRVVSDLQSKGAAVDASTLHELMKEVTKAGRAGDSKTRYLSGRLAGSINDAMELSIPGEKPVLDAAKSSWRQERGVDVLNKMYAEGGSILRIDPSVKGGNSLILNVNNLLNRTALNKELSQWLPASEYAALQNEIKTFAGTSSKTGILRQEPIIPEIKFNTLKDVFGVLTGKGVLTGVGGTVGGLAGGPFGAGVGIAAGLGVDGTRHVIAKMMVSERFRPMFLQWMEAGGGPMRPELAAAFAAVAAQVHGEQWKRQPGDLPPGSTQGQYRPGEGQAPAPARPVPGSTAGQYQRAY